MSSVVSSGVGSGINVGDIGGAGGSDGGLTIGGGISAPNVTERTIGPICVGSA